MRYLLDTHVWIWSLESGDNLPAKVRRLLGDASNLPFGLSAISPWEAVKKEAMGKLKLSTPIRSWLTKAVSEPFVSLLPLTVDVAFEANHLPGEFHRDPADQIIIATARIHGLTLVTCDAKMLEYRHVKTVWE